MLYCNLKGGLGNMLFEMAAAKSLSIDNNIECSFPNLHSNINLLNIDTYHNPSLTHAVEYLALFEDIQVTPITNRLPIYQYPFDFLDIPISHSDLIIDGFFQSEKYFKNNRDAVLKMFGGFKKSHDYIKTKYPFLFENRCTSIHVRRGDYLKSPNYHPTQTVDYYLSGIEILKDKTDIFVIFSDDINWCKENFKSDNIIYIEQEKDYIELYMMSLCDNHITCNSSFSWWGAWLNEKENKTVIGPKIWFGSAVQHNTGDILPENWIKL